MYLHPKFLGAIGLADGGLIGSPTMSTPNRQTLPQKPKQSAGNTPPWNPNSPSTGGSDSMAPGWGDTQPNTPNPNPDVNHMGGSSNFNEAPAPDYSQMRDPNGGGQRIVTPPLPNTNSIGTSGFGDANGIGTTMPPPVTGGPMRYPPPVGMPDGGGAFAGQPNDGGGAFAGQPGTSPQVGSGPVTGGPIIKPKPTPIDPWAGVNPNDYDPAVRYSNDDPRSPSNPLSPNYNGGNIKPKPAPIGDYDPRPIYDPLNDPLSPLNGKGGIKGPYPYDPRNDKLSPLYGTGGVKGPPPGMGPQPSPPLQGTGSIRQQSNPAYQAALAKLGLTPEQMTQIEDLSRQFSPGNDMRIGGGYQDYQMRRRQQGFDRQVPMNPRMPMGTDQSRQAMLAASQAANARLGGMPSPTLTRAGVGQQPGDGRMYAGGNPNFDMRGAPVSANPNPDSFSLDDFERGSQPLEPPRVMSTPNRQTLPPVMSTPNRQTLPAAEPAPPPAMPAPVYGQPQTMADIFDQSRWSMDPATGQRRFRTN